VLVGTSRLHGIAPAEGKERAKRLHCAGKIGL
jgi:hypothetical protein